MLKSILHNKISSGKKLFALLVDPDKHDSKSLEKLMIVANSEPGPDVILIGGSIVFNGIDDTVKQIKALTSKPVYLFPGSALQVSKHADGILLLSLISGRNPEFLIGNHVLAAPKIKKSRIEVIPTGYILVNSGIDTSVSYMSNTAPIPYRKNDIAVATALAGEMLGLQAIYLEAGSGAKIPVSTEMISAVKAKTEIPLIVGGGIRKSQQLIDILKAGADMIVIGTASENNPGFISEFARIIADY
ncbi:MAG: geranylgeranylglyceryl/heptaprenylglyceryl phosphate synthase [Salinivirgaceae bacterium]|jgi:phosphoglycerol geranylgeranyltransferase|nr:geranylgeranylglyceryl/heptaprenylglyceryl phosphate synthase [Salinivirgaceae bacterium]